jgi:hypothetical protein
LVWFGLLRRKFELGNRGLDSSCKKTDAQTRLCNTCSLPPCP